MVMKRIPENVTDAGNQSFWSGLGNIFTGNTDWQRSEIQRQTNNAFNAAEAVKQRQFESSQATLAYSRNAAEAQKARDFSERMSSTAYQRAVADMRAAGINPAAMVGGAQSASTPSASTASAPSARGVSGHSGGSGSFRAGSGYDSIARLAGVLISSGVNSALGASRIAAQKEIASANRDLSEELSALRLEQYEANRRQRAKFYTHGRGDHWKRFM